MQQVKIESPIGPLYLLASVRAVHGLYFKPQKHAIVEQANLMHKLAEKQIKEYFAGKRREFDLPLKYAGTQFQSRVWRELAKIPYGKTISYTELARRLKNPKAVRAVGSANGRNPISLLIPCHRVIAASGSLGGYAGGVEIKELLLKLEKALP